MVFVDEDGRIIKELVPPQLEIWVRNPSNTVGGEWWYGVSACGDCGALVPDYNKDMHDNWHGYQRSWQGDCS